jgi:hydrogenase maturation factor
VNVNANDVAAMGATLGWFLATILLPEDQTTEELVEQIFAQISNACARLGVAFVGGHTEVTYGLDRPIVVGQMLGEVAKDRLITSAGAQVGDAILLTKGVGIEATAIIAREKEAELRGRISDSELERARNFLYTPGISVVLDAALATANGEVHAMHDPTEGGLAMGLYELAWASGLGLILERDAVPIDPLTEKLCRLFDLDPLGVIASGALLLAVKPQDAPTIIQRLEEAYITAAQIGEMRPAEEGIKMRVGGKVVDLPMFPQDEIAKLFSPSPS